MLKSMLSALVAALIALTPTFAQSPDTEAVQGPALWMIEDEDNRVYLLGTVHLLRADTHWRTAYMDEIFSSVDEVWFEADVISPEAATQMQTLIPQLAMNAPGITLSSMISDEAKANIAIIAERLGAPPEQLIASFDPAQPWFASISMAVMMMQAQGFDPMSGVDRVLYLEAQSQDKPLRFFETVEQQLRFFSDMTLDVQVANFEMGLQQMVDDPEFLDHLVGAWSSGDMDTIDEIMNEDMREQTPELYDALLVVRNQNWAPVIGEIMEGDRDVFIAVGAGHMPGDQGVIALMRDLGYGVDRIQ